ncbi:MAG: TIGR04219 family outer membrane beta-barrel protein [Campylobacterales bacterium]|nr:TIGR04219 family outer membrane beta-barrel protein [Campylobacterales bacterium]
MKKVLSGLLLAGVLGVTVQADIVRVEMGGGVWNNELSGDITSDTPATSFDSDILDYDKASKGYIWAFIKHPIPVLPNLRLEYAAIDYAGTSTQSFTYKGTSYAASAKTDLTLDQFDIIMYYNLLDNTAWMTFDLGLDVKVIQAEFNAVNEASAEQLKETIPLPMAYGRLRFEIPGTDIGLEGSAKYTAYKNSKVSDYSVKADYTLVDILPVDVGLEVGYRVMQIDLDGTDFDVDTTLDIKVKGLFAGAVIRF